jgi:hypothetical protein
MLKMRFGSSASSCNFAVQFSAAGGDTAWVGQAIWGGLITALGQTDLNYSDIAVNTGGADTIEGIVEMHGWVQTTTNPGNFTIQSKSAAGGTWTVRAGSFLSVEEMVSG